MGALKSGAFWLRFIEMITSIVAFSTIVSYQDEGSRIEYAMFVGITGFVLALFFMIAYAAGMQAARGKLSLVLDFIWTSLWLVAAGCVSAVLNDGVNTHKMEASVAFSWISWFLWIGSTIISVKDTKGGVAGPPPAPTIPNSSVGMV